MQIDVIEEVKGTQFMQCKLYIDGNASVILMNKIDYERLKEEGIFIRDGKSQDSAGVLNTTNTFIEKINTQNRKEMKKTFKQWVKQDKDLDDFLSPGDYIDERLYNYIGEIIPPAYYSRDFIQGCDAIKNEGDVLFYITAHRTVDNRYLYLGVLPEFKQ